MTRDLQQWKPQISFNFLFFLELNIHFRFRAYDFLEGSCQRINSIQKFKLLGEVSGYDLCYYLTHLLKWKPFRLETCTDPHYFVFNFYQINRNDDIRTRDLLVIKVLISCQITNSTQKLKLLGEILGYDLYYFLTHYLKWKPFKLEICTAHRYFNNVKEEVYFWKFGWLGANHASGGCSDWICSGDFLF